MAAPVHGPEGRPVWNRVVELDDPAEAASPNSLLEHGAERSVADDLEPPCRIASVEGGDDIDQEQRVLLVIESADTEEAELARPRLRQRGLSRDEVSARDGAETGCQNGRATSAIPRGQLLADCDRG